MDTVDPGLPSMPERTYMILSSTIRLTVLENIFLICSSYCCFEEGDVAEAIRQGYLTLDSDMLDDEDMRDDQAGTTAICVVLKDGKIYCVRIYIYPL